MADFIQSEITLPVIGLKGQKDDIDPKLIPAENFSKIVNMNFPDDGGNSLTKMLMPSEWATLSPYITNKIQGIYNYPLFVNNVAFSTSYYMNFWLVVAVGQGYYGYNTSPTISYEEAMPNGGASTNDTFQGDSKYSFTTYNNKVFCCNGLDYPAWFTWMSTPSGVSAVGARMGAPCLRYKIIDGLGNFSPGEYKWAMTYVTAGGEEVIGTTSFVYATPGTDSAVLELPIGYPGTLSRNIYRTVANGTTLKLLASIPDNTTTTYTDRIADAALGATIPATNNECPKPYFLTSANQRLYGGKIDKFPTQVFVTDENYEVFDAANYVEMSDRANDSSPVEGLGQDFNNVIVGTQNNLYILQPSQIEIGAISVTPTRAYVGVKSGYSMINIPAFGDFAGGLMFVSSQNDVRILNGLDAMPVTTTVNNIRTQNFGQDIKGTLNSILPNAVNIHAAFFDYRYHLLVDGSIYILDTRNMQWTTQTIKTTTYSPVPNVIAPLNYAAATSTPKYRLARGLAAGKLEWDYQSVQYKSEDVNAYAISGYIAANRDYKQIKKIVFWYKSYEHTGGTGSVKVILDDDIYNPITATFTVPQAPFDPANFDWRNYQTLPAMNFIVVNINRSCKWFQYSLACSSGNISLQSIEFVGEKLNNKEA